MILGIDPGNELSAYCLCDYDTLKPKDFGKVTNAELIEKVIPMINDNAMQVVAVELIQSYGMAVGKEVFETCYFIGKLCDRIERNTSIKQIRRIYRKDEKLAICGNLKANDTIIRHTLIDMFAKHDFKNGKGTKQKPDWFYGFKADCWSAYAICYTAKMQNEGKI